MRNPVLLIMMLLLMAACSHPTSDEPTEVETEILDIWDNGNPKIVRYFDTNNGGRILFKETQYHPNGTKSLEGRYLNNKRDGIWKSWHDDGSLWSEGSFVAGQREGVGTVYFPNGQKQIEGHYKHGKRVGKWKYWDESGNLLNEAELPSE